MGLHHKSPVLVCLYVFKGDVYKARLQSSGSHRGVDLLSVPVVSDSRRRSSDPSSLSRSHSHNLSVDGARHTIVDLDVKLGQSILLVHRGL